MAQDGFITAFVADTAGICGARQLPLRTPRRREPGLGAGPRWRRRRLSPPPPERRSPPWRAPMAASPCSWSIRAASWGCRGNPTVAGGDPTRSRRTPPPLPPCSGHGAVRARRHLHGVHGRCHRRGATTSGDVDGGGVPLGPACPRAAPSRGRRSMRSWPVTGRTRCSWLIRTAMCRCVGQPSRRVGRLDASVRPDRQHRPGRFDHGGDRSRRHQHGIMAAAIGEVQAAAGNASRWTSGRPCCPAPPP